MKRSLSDAATAKITARLAQANREVTRLYPGESDLRQPVHTVYGGAHLFTADICAKLGERALEILQDYAPDAASFAQALGLPAGDAFSSTAVAGRNQPPALAQTIYERVRDKLRREPVEDFRIDFEDGYGSRPDAEEDGHAAQAAQQVAAALAAGRLPFAIGIRIKPLSDELCARSIRTLDTFVSTLTRETGGPLPSNFVVTLPKVTSQEQVAALANLLELLEQETSVPPGALKMELMVEATQTILSPRGECSLMMLAEAARRRCTAMHFGTYDYTAACNITAAHQHMRHPACDFAKDMMKVALAGTGIWLSDGATNVLPVPVHRETAAGRLTAQQQTENRQAIHHAWRLHYNDARNSLVNGYYQGWDLHPAQLPTRYAALYAFFLEGLDAAAERLSNFVGKAAQATVVGDVFDDAATGQGLLNYFLRALNCGAVTEDEVQQLTGLRSEELRLRSFAKIMKARSA